MSSTHKPHDALFKTIFGEHAEVVADALRALLPGPLFDALDLSTLTRVDPELIDEDLRRLRADVLYSAQLAGHEVLFYLLFEQQHTPVRLMPFRCGEYVFRIWARLIRRHRREHGRSPSTLPVILPIVIHTGPRPWSAPLRLEELFDLPSALLPLVRPFVPGLTLFLDDIPATDAEVLRTRPGDPLYRLVWLLFRHAAADPALLDRLRSWGDDLVAVWTRDGEAIGDRLFRYILLTNDAIDTAELSALMGDMLGERAQEVAMTAGERLYEDGRRTGRTEGREEGVQLAKRSMLLTLLRQKFGDLPESATSRIATADIEQLDRWLPRIFEARAVDDIFAA